MTQRDEDAAEQGGRSADGTTRCRADRGEAAADTRARLGDDVLENRLPENGVLEKYNCPLIGASRR